MPAKRFQVIGSLRRGAEDDGDDRKQVGDGRGGGRAFVLDEAEVEEVGEARAEGAEGEDAGDDVELEVDGLVGQRRSQPGRARAPSGDGRQAASIASRHVRSSLGCSRRSSSTTRCRMRRGVRHGTPSGDSDARPAARRPGGRRDRVGRGRGGRKPGGSWRVVPLVKPLRATLNRAWIAQGRPGEGRRLAEGRLAADGAQDAGEPAGRLRRSRCGGVHHDAAGGAGACARPPRRVPDRARAGRSRGRLSDARPARPESLPRGARVLVVPSAPLSQP